MKKNNEEVTSSLQRFRRSFDDTLLRRKVEASLPDLLRDPSLVARVRSADSDPLVDLPTLFREYLRFVYLALTMPDGATPSKRVDAVWHAHILHTRAYSTFCEGLGRVLHHEPGDGEADKARFDLAYVVTLDAYAAAFGDPPREFWPAAPQPFRGLPPVAPVQAAPRGRFVSWMLGLGVAGGATVHDDPKRRRRDDGSSGDEGAIWSGGDPGCPAGGHGCGDGGSGDGGASCGGGGCGGGCGGS